MRAIEINFPEDVEITKTDMQDLQRIARRIIKRYVKERPSRTMWLETIGAKVTKNPYDIHGVTLDKTDNSIFCIELNEQANFSWPCAHCGLEQDLHHQYMTNPRAGQCDYSPKEK